MSRTRRALPGWMRGGDIEADDKEDLINDVQRGKMTIDIWSGNEPHGDAYGPIGKKAAKRLTRRARRRGDIPVNFTK